MNLTEKVNPRIFRFKNQQFYGEEVGIYLIVLSNKLILFDLPIYTKELEDYLSLFRKPIIAFLSHGPCGIPDGKIWQNRMKIKIFMHKSDKDNQWLKINPDVVYRKPSSLEDNLMIILTPGHTPGSICFLDQKSKILFSGDTIAGTEDGEIRDFFTDSQASGDLNQRFQSCRKLLAYDFESILPFHYGMIKKAAKARLSDFLEKYS